MPKEEDKEPFKASFQKWQSLWHLAACSIRTPLKSPIAPRSLSVSIANPLMMQQT
ncbi:hypothetical protein [uncultured Nostoc sp.]|uniref:hypothetical protein n=1 Tax=uncultured Nostoc sp. TaxID=340711 RepID=UPI0035CA80C5